MVISPRLKTYAVVLGIFVLGAGAGGAAGYAVASKRLADVLGEGRPEAHEAMRFEALSKKLDLSREQRQKVRSIMQRHREEHRKLMSVVYEKCGGDLSELRARMDQEIRQVLDEEQKKRFGELMEKRGHRFPLGGPGRFRKGEGRPD